MASVSAVEVENSKDIAGQKISNNVEILNNKIEIIDNFENNGKIKYIISKDHSKMDVITSDDIKYTVQVIKIKKGYKILIYENGKLKHIRIADKNPIETTAYYLITNQYTTKKQIIPNSFIVVTPRVNIELDLPNYIGHVGDSECLTVTTSGRYSILTTFIHYYVRLPYGVEYVQGGVLPT
ncbi:hypothetical protein ACO3VM_06985 [Methanocaldococcus sp. 10A]